MMWWLVALYLLSQGSKKKVSGLGYGGDHRKSSGVTDPSKHGAYVDPTKWQPHGRGASDSFSPRPHKPEGHGADYVKRATSPQAEIPDDTGMTPPPPQAAAMSPYAYGGGQGTAPSSWQDAMDQAYADYYGDMYGEGEIVDEEGDYWGPGEGPGHWRRPVPGERAENPQGMVWQPD